MKIALLSLITATALLTGCVETPPPAEEIIVLESAPPPSAEDILAIN